MRVFRSLMNNTFTVYRRDRVSDDQGGWSIDFIEIGQVQGRIRPASDREREVANLQEREISHVLYVEAGSDVARGDVVATDRLMVEVESVKEPSLDDVHLEIECRERQFEVNVETGS